MAEFTESPTRVTSPFESRFPDVDAVTIPVPQADLPSGPSYDKTVSGFDELDYRSHRNVYVAVHVPYSIPRHHKRRKSHHRSHRTTKEQADEHIPEPKTPVDPCDRVKFILGGEEVDSGMCHMHSDASSHQQPSTSATHSLFTELEELKYDHHEHKMQWKETARWIKFEEDVEEGGDKWSKPHVATLSLHSLFELRSCMVKGSFLLDLDATNLAQISDCVLDRLVRDGQLEEVNREKVRMALLQRHRHQDHKDHHENKFLHSIRSFGDIGRTNSASKHMDMSDPAVSNSTDGSSHHYGNRLTANFPFSAPNLLGRMGRRFSNASAHSAGEEGGARGNGNGNGRNGNGHGRNGNGNGGSDSHLEEEATGGSGEELYSAPKGDQHFMKKIPPGSEASNVLVGEVDFLSHPIIAFVRLKEGHLLGDLTEVPIPTRFLFILLGTTGNHQRYHEIGRSIATLMSDEVFHDVAYAARNREDLLAGVDEFLDKVTVLPPGEWDPQIRIEPPPKVPSQADRRHVVAADEGKDDDSEEKPVVSCSKWPFGGLIKDVKRRYPKYWSDIRDVVSIQGLASIIFIYFANITPAITFGGVLSDTTNGALGVLEMILAVAIGNFVFSLFAGQPLVVLGGTGPTLIFEGIVYSFCQSLGIPYLNFRFWIGLWTSILMILLVAFSASVLMRLFTRFTEEIFSALISFIFIYEAFRSLWRLGLRHPYNDWVFYPFLRRACDCFNFTSSDFVDATRVQLYSFWSDEHGTCSSDLNSTGATGNSSIGMLEGCTPKTEGYPFVGYRGADCYNACSYPLAPNVYLMSWILFVGTFMISVYLKKFRNSRYFRLVVRRIISDFAVFIAVIVWVVFDVLTRVATPKLVVPDVFTDGFYSGNRTFIINPLGNDLPRWAPVGAIIPAFLATILLFMDQQITALIINRKDHNLKKGSGYHLDLLIVAVLIFVHSLLGLPWVVGATIRSITHVQSLFIYSPCTAPGDRPKFLGVREQRVTLFVMAILIGLSITAYQALLLLPLPVLYGIFLYIGVASLYGVQFVQRLSIIFMPDKYKPDYKFLRQIPNIRIHAFTLLQVLFLAVLCVFKVVEQISIVFPLMVLLLVVGRWLIGFCFSRRDLAILDDPISEKFYCKRFRREGSETDLEAGQSMLPSGDSEEKLESTDIKTNGTAPKQPESINMTKEMDRCDLWRNMVRNLDAPFPSPRRRVQHREPERDNCVPLGVVTEEVEALETSGGSGVEGVGGEGIKLELPSASKQYLSTEV